MPFAPGEPYASDLSMGSMEVKAREERRHNAPMTPVGKVEELV